MRQLAVTGICIHLLVFLSTGCGNTGNSNDPEQSHAQAKRAILNTINNETKAAFERNYESWQTLWVHSPVSSKTYINFADSTFSEAVGWTEVNDLVQTFFRNHPEAEPVPDLVTEIEVHLYHHGAYAFFEQTDSLRGRKRETRLLEKENGQWKIAGMHTTIYSKQ